MVSKMWSIICFAILLVEITNCKGQFNFFNQSPSVNKRGPAEHKAQAQSQLECAKKLQALSQELFHSQSQNCQLRFPMSRLGGGLARLRCMRKVCGSHTSQPICKNIAICDAEKEKQFGQAKFVVCVAHLFEANQL